MRPQTGPAARPHHLPAQHHLPAPPPALGPLLDAIPPASGAVVMSTGIVSVALLLDAQRTLSEVFLVLDALIWVVLVVLIPARARRDWARFQVDVRHPSALTAIAGTGVLGTRLTLAGWDWPGAALLVIAAGLWLCLVPYVLRHWQLPTLGVSFLLTVCTESLGVLAVSLAAATTSSWLLYAALVPSTLGMLFYLYVLHHFDWHQLITARGDHWVTGGALAISTLAAGRLAVVARQADSLGGRHGPLQTIALVLWCAAIAWLPALLLAEARHPRPHYSLVRWSTVFPLGMYAAGSFVVGPLTGISGITDFARIWVWVALAVWVVVCAGMVRRAPELARRVPQLAGFTGRLRR